MALSFVQITDHHLRHDEALLTQGYSTAYAFRAVLRHIAANVGKRIDFLVLTGDLVASGSEVEYATFRGMMNLDVVSPAPGPQRMSAEGLVNVPVYFLPGNHDDRVNFFRQLARGTPAAPLQNVAFERGGVQFIFLDWGTEAKAVLYPETLSFLKRTLSSERPSVILTHHHVVPTGARWLDAFLADDIEKFWTVVKGRNVLGIFSGHVHNTYESHDHQIPVYGLRSTSFAFLFGETPAFVLQPPHYRYVSIDDGLLSTRIFEVPI